MANRLGAPNLFAALSPPWLLSQLDSNSTQNQSAWNDSSLGFVNGICTDTGVANAYVITAGNLPFGAPSSYNSGMTLFFIPNNVNTGSSTIAVGALGTASILNKAGLALQGGELPTDKEAGIVYNNSSPVGFRIFTFCPLSVSFANTASVTVNCAGYDSVALLITWSSAVTTNIVLNNVAVGTGVTVALTNGFASSNPWSLKLTDTAANNFSNVIVGLAPTFTGGSNLFTSSSVTLQAGATVTSFSIGSGSTVVMTGTATGALASQALYMGLS